MTATLGDISARLPTGLLIGDEWVTNSSGGTMDHVSPATGLLQRKFPVAGVAEIDDAVTAAQVGLQAFRRWTATQRRDALHRLSGLVGAHANDFTTIAALECGMIQPMAAAMAPGLRGWLDYYAGWADKLDGDVVAAAGGFDYTRCEPIGVVASILTWNGPILSLGYKVAPALAAGCAIVIKPPELAPFGAALFGRLCLEAGFPPGVVNVVPGGPDAGDKLVRDPRLDKISFTGGPETARKIQAACAESLTPLVLELGGKSANIVFADADLQRAATIAAAGIVRLSGQVCVAPTRLLVQSSVYESVVEQVSAILNNTQVGDPFDPATQMGPVISEGARDRIMGVIQRTKLGGEGELVAGGEQVREDLGGFYVSPTAFANVSNSSQLAQQEIFGPVLAITPFDSEEEAVALANDTAFGLAAYLHTNDVSRVLRVAEGLDVGNVAVNGGAAIAAPIAPFGGFKDSGYGKEGGRAGIEEFLRVKNVNININRADVP
ncbi:MULTISPECIES: aldehyde dehydrogenase family protein [Mycobacterium]|uniref:aldehyde dehydrogenase family protein n=1 Tax=Mycobacterium TaxID=1763 RepID=UPI00200F9B57|nr:MULTISPECIES: aldehyde dehydrogenase family protein [Mycobacterium]UQB93106.1 aldehyde dehydrogenase family protein [Mycobacterium intracellulare]WSE46177.1 aldehyde dehydrogenase family protein [Mycobacterium sp. 3-98]